MPKVSVIIPTHNRVKLLRRSLSSVISQDYRDFEILIIDDYPGSDTENLVNSFQDNRIRYFKVRPMNASAARNFGIGQAKGEYIAFLDDDDEWFPTILSKELKIFARTTKTVALVYTGVNHINVATGQSNRYIPSTRGDVFNIFLEGCFIHSMSAVMIRTDVLLEVNGLDEAMPSQHDWDLYIRIAKNYKFECVPEALVNYYHHGGSITRDMEKQIQGWSLLYEKHWQDIKSRKVRSNYYLRRGVLLYFNGRAEEGRQCLVKSILTNWRNFKVIPLLGLSMMGAATFNRAYNLFEASPFATGLISVSDHGTIRSVGW